MNFSLSKTWEQYVTEQVESGVFNNASEVVRDALRRQQEQLLKLEALRRALAQGLASIKTGDVSRPGPKTSSGRQRRQSRGDRPRLFVNASGFIRRADLTVPNRRSQPVSITGPNSTRKPATPRPTRGKGLNTPISA